MLLKEFNQVVILLNYNPYLPYFFDHNLAIIPCFAVAYNVCLKLTIRFI